MNRSLHQRTSAYGNLAPKTPNGEPDELDNVNNMLCLSSSSRPHFFYRPQGAHLLRTALRTGCGTSQAPHAQCQYTPPHVAMILLWPKSSSCTVLELATPVWKLDRVMALEVPHNIMTTI
uniref:Uncharacterized protein n=1 Tax=Anopheles maculatus TaxID=74869 RepID=A0A182TAS4_9DIPT